MSRRWIGRGSGLVTGCLVSAITLLGASAPRAFADTPPINGVTSTVDATTDDAIAAAGEVVTSDIPDPVQETSVNASIEATTDPAAGTPDTTSADTAATETTAATPDVLSEATGTDADADGTSEASVGVTDTASWTSEAIREAPEAAEVTSADVTPVGATTGEDAASTTGANLDSATETTSDAIDVGSSITADETIGPISAPAGSGEQPPLDATVAASETITDVAAMVADASTEATDVVETPVATDGTGAISEATSEITAVVGDATVEAVSMVEDLATVEDTAAGSAADLTPEISTDVTAVGDIGSEAAAVVVETISDTAGMMTDGAAEATTTTEAIALTGVGEASAITVEPSATLVDAAAEATWATFESVATEASATGSDVASLETVMGTTSTTSDATTTVSGTSSEVMTTIGEVLVFADLTAQTVIDSVTTTVEATTDITALLGETATQAMVALAGTTAHTIPKAAAMTIDAMIEVIGTADAVVGMVSEITSETVGAGPGGTSDAVTALSEPASTLVPAVGSDGALADLATVLSEAKETVVSDLDAASIGSTDEASQAISGPTTLGRSILGGSSPMRNERLLLSVTRNQTEDERVQGNEPIAPCKDASSLNCALAMSADGIDSLVESVASIIKILALTGLRLLPWLTAAGMLASLGGVALAGSRRRRSTCSLRNGALPPGSHVEDAWAYS